MCGPCGTSDICQECINNPNKEEFMFEEEAEKYVAEKADKGNFDVEKFGKAYFSESAMRLAFKAGADFGFKECAKSRLNITTISDAPIDYAINEKYGDSYGEKLRQYEDRIEQLEEQIEEMKNCKNCANYMISGKCPCFFRTGWCKNWELAK